MEMVCHFKSVQHGATVILVSQFRIPLDNLVVQIVCSRKRSTATAGPTPRFKPQSIAPFYDSSSNASRGRPLRPGAEASPTVKYRHGVLCTYVVHPHPKTLPIHARTKHFILVSCLPARRAVTRGLIVVPPAGRHETIYPTMTNTTIFQKKQGR